MKTKNRSRRSRGRKRTKRVEYIPKLMYSTRRRSRRRTRRYN